MSRSAVICAEHPALTVIVATLGRSERLRDCVQSVLNQGCERLEVIVVLSGAGAEDLPALDGLAVRIVRQKIPGVSQARNAALPHARGEILAFLDDDVIAAPGWAHAIVDGFSAADVHCVAGRVVPEGPAYMPVDRYATPRIMSRWTISSRDPGWVGRSISCEVGFGCNMAFRRSFLEKAPFPRELGSGSVVGCGDEAYMFFEVVRQGLVVLHTPDAAVTHFFGWDGQQRRSRLEHMLAGNVAFCLYMIAHCSEQRTAFVRQLLVRALRVLRLSVERRTPNLLSGFTASDKLRILVAGIRLFCTMRSKRDAGLEPSPAAGPEMVDTRQR